MADIKIGIIGAMDSEVELLRSKIENSQAHSISGMEFVEGTIAQTSVVVVKCGVGKVNAAVCAQTLIAVFGVTHIINTGVAGSLDKQVRIGDIVVSTDAVEHDMDVTALGYGPGEHPDLHQVAFEADEGLRKIVTASAIDTSSDIRVFHGRVSSGDQFIASQSTKNQLQDTFGGMCCEMEGASIAHVCHLAQIPFVIVRSISDSADDSGSIDYTEFEKESAKRCAALVLVALPRIA